MSSATDSKPFFQARAKVIGFDDAQILELETGGVDSMASMTFMCNYQPAASDDKPLVDAVIRIFKKDPPDARTLVMVRRLHFEAHAIYLSDLKTRVTATEDEAPRKVPVAERAARHYAQQVKLTGIKLENEMECSHQLLDAVNQQFERNELKFIPITQCTSREQEQSGHKKDPMLAMDAEGQITVKAGYVQARADTSTDFKLYQAMNRRGLAYDQANLVDYLVHCSWVEYLFSAMQRRVPDGFQPISYQQIVRADKELWRKMADDTRAGIVPTATGVRPLDISLAKWMQHSDVLFYLLPVPASRSEAQGSSYRYERSSHDSDRYSPKGDKGGYKGDYKGGRKGSYKGGKKGSGKGSKGQSHSMPEGCVTKTDQGKNLCFAYNSSRGCQQGKPGQRCGKGMHLCARPGCFGSHSALACPKASN